LDGLQSPFDLRKLPNSVALSPEINDLWCNK
jgi:hypothetical protein